MAQKNQANEKESKKQYRLDLIRTILSSVLLLTVLIGFLQWRATIKNEAANRFLNIIDKLGLDCNSVRAGAVITMGAHLRDNYEEYRNQSIPVLVAHLTIERAPQVRSKIVNILKSEEVKPDDVIGPLIWEIRDFRLKDGDSQYLPVLDFLIRHEQGSLPRDGEETYENLIDMSKALVSVLQNQNNPTQISDLSGCILMDWSANQSNLERANFEAACLFRVCFEQANLRKADFRDAEFYDANFTGAFLQEAKLSEASLRGAILNNAELSDAILKHAELDSTDLRDANLTNANLIKADLGYADMKEATLRGAELCEALLIKANLTNANLIKADLGYANMKEATLKGAELFEALLKNADLTDANLTDANLTEADLDGAVIYGTFLRNAILEKASLKGAKMIGSHLEGANLKAAGLESANLSRADLRKANLTDANLRWAILQGTDLSGANMERADLESANLKAKVLFSIDPNKFQKDIEKGLISEDLRQEFINNGFYLSQSSTLSVEKKDEKWLINDNETGKEYDIRKGKEQLNICIETKFDFEVLKKAKNWDKAIL
jgi:uncharacterized protein YjbI with pentapeptide repeats